MKHDTVELLKAHGINPSSQRVRIYDYLVASKDHPSVDDIFLALQKEGHLFSRATVYNTVKLFLEKHLIRPVKVASNEMRFDASHSFHGHFRCEECDKIFDIPIEELSLDGATEHQIHETNVSFSGICAECLKKGKDD